jgi:hypothetical protein
MTAETSALPIMNKAAPVQLQGLDGNKALAKLKNESRVSDTEDLSQMKTSINKVSPSEEGVGSQKNLEQQDNFESKILKLDCNQVIAGSGDGNSCERGSISSTCDQKSLTLDSSSVEIIVIDPVKIDEESKALPAATTALDMVDLNKATQDSATQSASKTKTMVEPSAKDSDEKPQLSDEIYSTKTLDDGYFELIDAKRESKDSSTEVEEVSHDLTSRPFSTGNW